MFSTRLYLAFPIILALCLAAGLTPLPAYHVWDDGRSITNSIGMKLVRIPAGKFLMGSPKDEEDHHFDEEQHEVEITKPFYMGVYPVTQAEYQQVMGKNPSCFGTHTDWGRSVAGMDTSRFPVECVSWNDAVDFCKKLSELPKEKVAGRVYRLPTEAEWEYACRAGTKTIFHCGNTLSSKQANFDGNKPYGGEDEGPYLARPTTVGSYQPNAFGLYDMHGNVWQWCQDWQENAGSWVVRGGSWACRGGHCRSASRGRFGPGDRLSSLGFRVAAVQSDR